MHPECPSFRLFAGRSTGPPPGEALCLAQAVLFIPTPPMLAVSAFLLVLHVAHTVFSVDAFLVRPTPTFVAIIAPYATYFFIAIPVLVVAFLNQNRVIRRQLYCYIEMPFVPYVVGILSGVILLLTLILQVWTAYILRRDYRRILDRGVVDTPLAIRVIGFAVYILICTALSFAAIADFTAVVPDLFVSTVPLAAFFIFGSQRNILRIWRSILAYFTLNCVSFFSRPSQSAVTSPATLHRDGDRLHLQRHPLSNHSVPNSSVPSAVPLPSGLPVRLPALSQEPFTIEFVHTASGDGGSGGVVIFPGTDSENASPTKDISRRQCNNADQVLIDSPGC
ncbi:hypothetical protein BS47DRAFT_1352149 [Hydnum rufescens UP504]|uniref:Uncharacterized protein n=1 Tax=Hydnum rufescens UP504 TaxID=1448309 RepID=A0A9P6AKM2_9AGAM|nr:hypothetical protein BS47DRAFT_1352149 [Hydnum rufescens UP504]